MKVVIGVDSGGSKTRALAVGLDGAVFGFGEGGGGNPGHDSNYCENIRGAIQRSANAVGIENVVRVVAGIAGFDREEDREWAEACTAAPGICAPQVQVNDAVIAHYGAFGGMPGIVSIQGDGSMIYGRTEAGRTLRNYDFRHYARAAGPWIGSNAVHLLLARGSVAADEAFAAAVCDYWAVVSLTALHAAVSDHRDLPYEDLMRKYGDMAPIVTQAATDGSPLAEHVCRDSASQVVDGIRLLGRAFSQPDVSIVLIGSCIRSPYMRRAVEEGLACAQERQYRVIEPAYSPVVGAVLMALYQQGIDLSDESLMNLAKAG